MKGLSILVVAFATFILTEATSSNVHARHARALETLTVEPKLGMKLVEPINIVLEGEFHWEFLFNINNRRRKKPLNETRKITRTVTTNYSELKDFVYKEGIKPIDGLEFGGMFDIITVDVKGISEEVASSYQTLLNQKNDTTVTEEVTQEFTADADSFVRIFMLVYKGPGVTYEFGTFATSNVLPVDKVIINCTVRNIPMIKHIGVKFANRNADMPDDVITEATAGNPDINAGSDIEFAFLYPVWVTKKDDAATGIQLAIQTEPDEYNVDLAADAGEYFRYLKSIKNPDVNTRIKRVGLLRGEHSRDDIQKLGWDDCTGDINEHRDGGYLYLCWNVVS